MGKEKMVPVVNEVDYVPELGIGKVMNIGIVTYPFLIIINFSPIYNIFMQFIILLKV